MGLRSVRFEWAPGNLWLGGFWRRRFEPDPNSLLKPAYANVVPRVDIWICFIPCVPLHLVFGQRRRRHRSHIRAVH